LIGVPNYKLSPRHKEYIMILLLEDYKIISNVLVHENGSRIIIYNKQDVEQLKQAFRVTPYLDLLSEQIVFLGRGELDTVIHLGTILF
jgi:hypothetical protein